MGGYWWRLPSKRATLIREYANRKDRGKLITFVFSTQALGLIIGPLFTYILLISHIPADLVWRIILGAGAIPALATFWLSRQISESPRFALAQGTHSSTFCKDSSFAFVIWQLHITNAICANGS